MSNRKMMCCLMALFVMMPLLYGQWVETTIDIGYSPYDLVYNQNENKLYSANLFSNNVTIIDGVNNTMITTVQVGSMEYGGGILVYNSINNRIYCVNCFSDNISVIDGSTNLVTATIPMGNVPYAVVYNNENNKIYCANMGDNNVKIIDGTTNSIIATVPTGSNPHTLLYNPTNNVIYCANLSGSITVIDGTTNNVVGTIPVGTERHALVYNTSNAKLYCANYDGTVSVINALTNSVITTVTVGECPYALVYNSLDNKIYCANRNSNNVMVINGTTNTVTDTIPVQGYPMDLFYDEINNEIYCSNYDSLIPGVSPQDLFYMDCTWDNGNVTVIDGEFDTIITVIEVGINPIKLCGNQQFHRVYVANFSSSTSITVLYDSFPNDIEEFVSNKVLRGIEIYPNPVRTEFTIRTQNIGSKAQIFDVLGCLVKSMELNQKETNVSLQEIDSGIYFVQYGKTVTKMVVTK